MRAYLAVCIDGCSSAYLRHGDTPTLDALMSEGFYREVHGMVSTVTNVSSVSIVTSAYPERHGITGNYYFDRETGQGRFTGTADLLLCRTIFEWARSVGLRSALLTGKDRLRVLLDNDATASISAETPPAWLLDRLGYPPSVYSLEVNHWLIAALRDLIRRQDAPELLCLATTDYAVHRFAPEDEQSQEHLSRLDRLLGEVLNALGGRSKLL